MNPTYTYISSVDYINNLSFDYFETYSLQRGVEFDQFLVSGKSEYEKLKIRKEKDIGLSAAEENRFTFLHELLMQTQYLINKKGELHPSAKKIRTFKSEDDTKKRLRKILSTEIKEIPRFLCAPLYRDAIIFYDAGNNIVSALNICLSCLYMETSIFNHINGDFETYDLLKRFFLEIGHEVEKPDYFILDDLNKLKAKT